MKNVILVFCLILSVTTVHAQQFQNSTTVLNAGIGFGGTLDGWGNQSPSLSASIEKGFWDISGPGVISLGAYLGTQTSRYNDYWGSYYSQRWRYTIIGARGAYHYNGFSNIPELDLYAGAMLSYNILSYSYTDANGNRYKARGANWNSGLGLTGFLGGRWFFKDNLAAYAEVGYGISALSIGVSFKLK